MGISCVMVVSRSWGKTNASGLTSPNEVSALELGSAWGKGASSALTFVVGIDVVVREEARLLVTIVRERRGILSFFVKRMDAEVAVRAERRARWRRASGMRRFIVFFSTAD